MSRQPMMKVPREKIKLMFAATGLSKKDLASRMGLTPYALQAWANNGKMPVDRYVTLIKYYDKHKEALEAG